MVRFLTSLVLAGWICAIALIAAQNGTRVVVQFIGLQSIQIPLGIVLAFSAAAGMVGTAIVLPLLRSGGGKSLREDFE